MSSRAEAQRASLPCQVWDLPRLGTEPVSLALQGGFLTTGPPQKLSFIISSEILSTLTWGHIFRMHNIFNRSIADLQGCVNFCCTTEWFSYTHIYILFYIIFHYSLSQDTEYNSLGYAVGPCCLSILYIMVYISWFLSPILSSLMHSLLATGLFSMPMSLFLFCRQVRWMLSSLYTQGGCISEKLSTSSCLSIC